MPVVTTPPVQVSATSPQFRQPGGTNFSGINPFYFEVGTQLYQSLANSQLAPNRLGMFKRAVGAAQGAWTEKDAADSPDAGNITGSAQSLFNSAIGKIAVLYVLAAGIKICEFDTATDTWGAPSALLTYTVVGTQFAFVVRSDGTYVVIGTTTSGHLFYATLAAGVWSGPTGILASPVQVFGGVIDSTDTIHFLLNQTSFSLDYRQLSSGFVLGAATQVSVSIPFNEGGRPTIILWGSSSVAIGHIHNSDVRVSIGTPLAAPVFTLYTIATSLATPGFSTVAAGTVGDLNNFYTEVDPNASPDPIDRMMQSTFDGVSTWSAPITFYDEVANPPANTVPLAFEQFVHTADAIELPQGWTVATTMETVDPIDPEQFWCTGFFLEAATAPPATVTISGALLMVRRRIRRRANA